MKPKPRRPVVAFIPPACCGSGYFRRVKRILGDRVDFRSVELPGHGRRCDEPSLTQARTAARDIVNQISGPVDAVYGESLGAYIGLEVAAIIQPGPLLLAASNSPPSARSGIHLGQVSSIDCAIAVLTAMGGEVPAEVVRDPAVAQQAYSMMRDDLYLFQSFIDLTRATTVSGDIHVFGGTEDHGLTRLEAWAAHTTGRCEVRRLPGRHLLSASNPSGVAEAVAAALETRYGLSARVHGAGSDGCAGKSTI